MTWWSFYNSINFYLGLLVAEFVVCCRMKRRKLYWLWLVAGAVIPVLLSLFWDNMLDVFTLSTETLPLFLGAKFLFIFVFFVGGIALAYDGDIWTYLTVGIAAYSAQHISYQIYSIIDANWDALPNYGGMLLLIAISAAVYAGIYWLFVRKLEKNSVIPIDNRFMIPVLILLLVVSVFISLYGKMFSGRAGEYSNVIFTVTCLLSVICNILGIICEIAIVSKKKSEIELALLKMMVHSARAQYSKIKDNIDIINIKCHDLKHQLSMFRDRINTDELERINAAVDIYDSEFKTGNDALDVILTEKSFYCKAKNIRFTCMLDGKAFDKWRESDIYSFFGNAIDNAIQGVEQLDDEKKIISISEGRRGEFYSLKIENFFSGNIEFENGLPVTKKKNKNYHGFGMKSMKMIVERYGGEMGVSLNDDIFCLNVLLYPEIKGQSDKN